MAIKQIKATFVGDQSADSDFRAVDPSVQPDDEQANNGGTPFFNDSHDREKYNADVTAEPRRVGSARFLTIKDIMDAYDRHMTKASIRRSGRLISVMAAAKPKKGTDAWYREQNQIAGQLGSAIANKRTAEVKQLLAKAAWYDLVLYGTVGKPPPGVKSGDAGFFFSGDWRNGKVVFPAVVCKRPDGSKRVASMGTCG